MTSDCRGVIIVGRVIIVATLAVMVHFRSSHVAIPQLLVVFVVVCITLGKSLC